MIVEQFGLISSTVDIQLMTFGSGCCPIYHQKRSPVWIRQSTYQLEFPSQPSVERTVHEQENQVYCGHKTTICSLQIFAFFNKSTLR